MDDVTIRITYIGGPTALLELGGVRLLTDPTFDPGGSAYTTPVYTLHKSLGPALAADAIGQLDAVLLSHDQHFDNLDRSGRSVVALAGAVITTPAAAERIGHPAIGLEPWTSIDLPTAQGHLRVTGTPCRHGPPNGDRGPVTGFVLTLDERPDRRVYVSGDTVWYEGVAEVARRFSPAVAVLFMGAARVREVGPAHLTLTAEEGVEVARAMPDAVIVPVHFEGWEHFSEGRAVIAKTFADAGLGERLRWLTPGTATPITR